MRASAITLRATLEPCSGNEQWRGSADNGLGSQRVPHQHDRGDAIDDDLGRSFIAHVGWNGDNSSLRDDHALDPRTMHRKEYNPRAWDDTGRRIDIRANLFDNSDTIPSRNRATVRNRFGDVSPDQEIVNRMNHTLNKAYGDFLRTRCRRFRNIFECENFSGFAISAIDNCFHRRDCSWYCASLPHHGYVTRG